MENLEYKVDKYKIRIENLTILPNGDVFADFYMDRIEKPGISYNLENLEIKCESFEDFYKQINKDLFEKYNIIFLDRVVDDYFRRAYGYCKQIIKQGLKQ